MHKLAAACLLATLTLLAATSAAFAQDQARRLVALLDYLGGDYQNAVQNGKIVNKDEYAEMQEFSKRIIELIGQLKAIEKTDKAQIEPMLKSLVGEVEKKGDEKTVAKLANDAKERLIATYKIVPHPRQLPALADGRTIFIENCLQCHGPGGKGDGPGRESMNPKTPLPANLTDPEFMAGLSPFKAYNTVSFGIENTAMASFAALSDEQRWQVAFYALALRFPAETSAAGEAWLKGKSLPPDLVNVATLATTSDGELSTKIKKLFPDGPNGAILAYLRRGLLEKKSADPLLIARTLIGEAATLYSGGENEKAYQKAIEAYLDGFEMAEPALFAKDGSLGRSLENQFTQFRNSIRQRVPVEEIQKQRREIDLKLDQAGLTLASGDENLSGFYAFLNSALIILREGLEATLILAAIIAMLKVMGAATAIRYIHLGWVLALIAGAVTWLAAQTVLTFSGQHRESMEGFISIFAAAALFYVGYWLHTRTEAKRWHAFIQDKVQTVLSSKNIFGLVGISFFAVYREAFEVVLFYQALWLQNEHSHNAIVGGFGAGVAALVGATYAILKLGLRLPLKYFFGVTGTLLYIMAFIFAGTGVNQLQAAGWLPATPVNFPPPVPLLGIYPTIESLAAQGILLCVFFGTALWMAHERKGAVA